MGAFFMPLAGALTPERLITVKQGLLYELFRRFYNYIVFLCWNTGLYTKTVYFNADIYC